MVVVTRFGRLSGWRDQSRRCHGTSNHHFQGNDLGGRGAAADIAVPGSALLHSRWCSRWLRGSSGRASHHSWCRGPWCGCNARRWCRCPWRRGAAGGRSWRGSQRRRSGQSPRTPLRLQLSDAASSIAPTQSWALLSRHRDAQGAYGSAQSSHPVGHGSGPLPTADRGELSPLQEVYRQASEAGPDALLPESTYYRQVESLMTKISAMAMEMGDWP